MRNYKRLFWAVVAMAATMMSLHAEVTLEECLTAARDNYPLIKKYDLLQATENVELSDINKGWLPKIGVYAQGTVQNVVPSFPASLSNVMKQMGGDLRGLGKVQYKAGLDISQTIWDGGASRAKREVSRRQTEADCAALDVEMYDIRRRVESIYFGVLLLQSQIQQMESGIEVCQSNLHRLRSMLANGAAMQSDVDMVEAQLLMMTQQLTSARSAQKSYRSMLSIFTGLDLADEPLAMPEATLPADLTPRRPELAMLDAQLRLNDSRRQSVDVATMPKVGLFAQTYYGYPGIDYFKAMMNREPTFNILAGVKLTWNIDSFYTRKNALRRIALADEQVDVQRDLFLFNNSMQSASQIQQIEGLEQVMKDDARIVELRRNVRLASESQLRNGIIDATALTTKINDETQAMLNASYHSIQHLQAIYNLKNILNR